MNKSQLTFSQAEVQSSRQNSFLNENNIMRCFENAPNTFSPNRFLNMYEQKNRIVDNADDEHMRSFGGNTGESNARNESKVMKLEDHSPVSLNKHICCSDVGSSENELSQFFGNHSFQYDDVYRVASPVLCNNSLTYTQHKNHGFLGQGNIENNNISFSKIPRNLISNTKEVRTFDNNPLEIFIDSQPEFRARAIKSPILTKNSKHKNTVPYESERDIPVTDISSDISIYKQYKKTSNNSCKKLDLNIESDTDESRSAVKHVNLTESFDCNRSKLGHLLEDIFSHNADSNNHYDPNKKQLGKSSQIVDSDTDRVYKVNEDKRACFIESEKLSKDSLIDPNKRFKRGQDRIHLNIGESFNLVDAYRNNGQRDNQGCFYTLKDSQSISEDVSQFTELSPVSKERLNQCVAQREIQSHFNSTKHTFGANQINSKQIIQNDEYKQRSQSDTVQKMKKSALTTKVWFNENDLSSTQRLIQHNLNSVHQNNQDNSNSYLKCFHDNPEKANHHWQCVFKSPFGIKPNGKVNAQKTSQSVSDLTDSAIRINSNGTYDYNVAKQLNPYSLSSVQNFSNIGQIYDYIIQYGSEKSHKHINSTVVQGFISEGLFNTVGIIQEDMKPAKTFEKYNKYGTSSTIPDDLENIKQVIEGRTDVTQVSQYNPDTEQQVLQHDLQNQQKTVEKDLNKIEQVIQDTSNKAQFSQDDSQNNKQGLIQDGLDSEQGVAQDDLDSEQVVQDDSVGAQNLLQDYSELIQKHLDSKQCISVKKQEVSQDYSDDKQNIIQGCLVGKQEIFRGDSFDKQNTIQDRSDSKHEVIQDDSCDKQKAILYHLYSKQDILQDKSYDKQEDILCHLDKFRHEAIQTDIRRPQHAVHNCFKKSKLTIQDSLNHVGKVSQNNLDVAEIIIQVNKRAAKPFARDALEDEKQVSENVLSDEKDLQTLVERLQEAYHRDDTTMVVKYGRKLLQLLQELKTEADDEKIKSLETPEFISLLLDVIEFSDIEGDGQVTDIYIKLLLVLYHLRRPSCVILESIRLRETAVTFTSRLTTLFKYYVADKMEDSGGQQLLLLLNDIFSSDVCKMFLYTEVKTLLAETSGHLDKGCNCYTNTCAFAMFRNKLLNCINMYWSA
ncbi:uncharacterized protein LOC143238291 [Tachypleus tridentatus]|uniref:uncharacterized protein LOC143238291 n=1 Tax=Tachypleus tridentatus TaxID=6853 RepID=UPI003FD34556